MCPINQERYTAALDTVPRFQPLVLATVVDPGGFPTRTGRPVGRWWPASSSAGDGLIVLSSDSLTLRSEAPANVARHPQRAVNGHRRGLATGPEGLSPRLEDGKEPVRVSSVVVAVTLGTALTRFGEAVRVLERGLRSGAVVCLYDGVAAGEGRLRPFLVIRRDGRGGVFFPALDDVESPDVEAGAREFAGKVG